MLFQILNLFIIIISFVRKNSITGHPHLHSIEVASHIKTVILHFCHYYYYYNYNIMLASFLETAIFQLECKMCLNFVQPILLSNYRQCVAIVIVA